MKQQIENNVDMLKLVLSSVKFIFLKLPLKYRININIIDILHVLKFTVPHIYSK